MSLSISKASILIKQTAARSPARPSPQGGGSVTASPPPPPPAGHHTEAATIILQTLPNVIPLSPVPAPPASAPAESHIDIALYLPGCIPDMQTFPQTEITAEEMLLVSGEHMDKAGQAGWAPVKDGSGQIIGYLPTTEEGIADLVEEVKQEGVDVSVLVISQPITPVPDGLVRELRIEEGVVTTVVGYDSIEYSSTNGEGVTAQEMVDTEQTNVRRGQETAAQTLTRLREEPRFLGVTLIPIVKDGQIIGFLPTAQALSFSSH